MASGAERRARKRAAAQIAADAERIRELRRMAESDPARESPNHHLRIARTFKPASMFDEVSMHGRVCGDGLYSGMRTTDMGRQRDTDYAHETREQRLAREAKERRSAAARKGARTRAAKEAILLGRTIQAARNAQR